jgi:hypothetical protein
MLLRPALARAGALLAALALAAQIRAGEADATAVLTAETVRGHVDKLASEELEGRGAGDEGGHKAGDYIAAELARLGVEPAGDDGTFFQSFKSGKRSLRNVIGTIGGTAEPEEVIVIGAHYDHLGMGHHEGMLDPIGGRGKIHPGADDNASGTAGVLTLAKAFTARGAKPRRRVVFVLFDGEELGLLGSRHYVRAPAFPLDHTVAMLNMDMIGRARGKLTVYGSNTGSGLRELCDEAAKGCDLKLDWRDTMPPNSDHWSFYQKKIPSIALFTGLHADYHRASDTPDKLDAVGEAKVLHAAWGIASGLAKGEDRPVYARAKDGTLETMVEQLQALLEGGDDMLKPLGGREGVQKMLDRLLGRQKDEKDGKPVPPAFGRGDGRPKLGVQLSNEPNDDGVAVEDVVPDSIAEKGGVEAGDVIVSLGGDETKDFAALRAAVAKAHGKTTLVVLRDGKRVELTVEFPGAEKPKKRWI